MRSVLALWVGLTEKRERILCLYMRTYLVHVLLGGAGGRMRFQLTLVAFLIPILFVNSVVASCNELSVCARATASAGTTGNPAIGWAIAGGNGSGLGGGSVGLDSEIGPSSCNYGRLSGCSVPSRTGSLARGQCVHASIQTFDLLGGLHIDTKQACVPPAETEEVVEFIPEPDEIDPSDLAPDCATGPTTDGPVEDLQEFIGEFDLADYEDEIECLTEPL